MKYLFLAISLTLFSFNSFSQETKKDLTDEQKAELRKNHKSGLSFSTKKTTTKNITTSNNTEEIHVKGTHVKYYYGAKDTVFKEFNYVKP